MFVCSHVCLSIVCDLASKKLSINGYIGILNILRAGKSRNRHKVQPGFFVGDDKIYNTVDLKVSDNRIFIHLKWKKFRILNKLGNVSI
jgi:hypothetical protein